MHRLTPSRGRTIVGALAFLLAGIVYSIPAFAAEPSMQTKPDANAVGIWKAYVPHGLTGELDSYDPIGLISGALIKADCSLNWRDPDTGKLYCFASGTSLDYFEAWPHTYIKQAQDALKRLQSHSGS